MAPFRGTGREEKGAGLGKKATMYLGICEGQGACATGLELRRTASARDKELRVNVLSETM